MFMRTRRTTNTFKIEASKIHENKYDYSLVDYIRIDQNVTIICPIHGPFEQTPHTHLIYRSGCPKCSQEQSGDNTKTFISKAIKVHGNKYDYSQVVYKNNSTKVTIICPIHGPFSQLPSNHINRISGCPTCGNLNRKQSNRMTFDEVVVKANAVHNNKYKYLADNYTNVSGQLKIICPTHGLFFQRGTNHVYSKQGCPQCVDYGVYTKHYFNERPDMKNVDGVLYFISFNDGVEYFYKIGITRRTVEQRYAYVKHYKYDCLYEWSGTLFNVFNIEQQIIKEFSEFKYTPQVKLGGDNECFKLNENQVDSLINRVRSLI